MLAQAVMETEVSGQIGAAPYERSTERTAYRNGYRTRRWDTRVGTIELKIPKVTAALIAKLVGDESELEASGLPAFERDLRSFLLREKGRTILESVAGRALRLVDDERNTLDIGGAPAAGAGRRGIS